MSSIKVGFINFWPEFNARDNIFITLLRKSHKVEVLDDASKADYVFFSLWGNEHWYLPDRCIKIFYTGEHICPDFNSCDYAMGFDWLDYGDRYFRLPHYLIYKKICPLMEQKHLNIDIETLLKEKTKFCSFTVSNNKRCAPFREQMFYALSEYKKVDSGGRWNNNVGGPVADKFEFDKKHKFSICFENIAHRGYTTEKIVQSFAAVTIPIYWGDPDITKVFNSKAFINVRDYDSLDAVVDAVKKVDENQELYLSMLKQPALSDECFSSSNQLLFLQRFLDDIVNQPIEQAQRRNRLTYYVENRKKMIEGYYASMKPSIPVRIYKKLKNILTGNR